MPFFKGYLVQLDTFIKKVIYHFKWEMGFESNGALKIVI